ncbi:SAM-dependent methyltransferase [Bacillus sp. DTU_2020_1000418_1_SI_GHA_SEK_038]|uniref:class I SAM-dependent methyltransferase n=1 Tax=Bacillus sp. DTU_2020_1000418_1_SI_GHA_SEK_038 TaxID=3077585 RepID=UPI0028E60B2D|nr:SAM-dependent methyltransferase [Bacillus sp. DTU_2020_1000418_1_SI_GHA_SEK_038]WNS74286.1 SAM-dependent methyltransferase [Bacillus sp. DTU_2020_1000418_1_SI_GHA_SEK_038]
MISFLKKFILNHPLKRITYADYIEMALYHPEFGYYMRDKEKIGRTGDFITTSNISDIYGRSIAKWYFKQMTQLKLAPAICEIGAGTGRFAKAFIDEWNHLSSVPIHYYILEASPYHRKVQQDVLDFNDYVKQIESLDEINPFEGLIFSNELYDALPVHVVENHSGQLMELMVGLNDDQFVEIAVPLENEKIMNFIKSSGLKLKNNQRIEIPLLMEEIIGSIATALSKGLVLTVDYGYTNEEWLEQGRRDGSLRGYYQHQQFNHVLVHPGEMDITSHVHFDSLIRIGDQLGLAFQQKWRQDEFLLETGILDDLQNHYDPDPFSEVSKRNRAIRSLIMPSGISGSFHVILQKKGIK